MTMNQVLPEETGGKREISSEVRFYTQKEVGELTGWSDKVIRKLFRDPAFPSAELGKAKIVEAHALIEYFSVRRERCEEQEFRKGDLRDELKQRML